jgi:hypothetical protein
VLGGSGPAARAAGARRQARSSRTASEMPTLARRLVWGRQRLPRPVRDGPRGPADMRLAPRRDWLLTPSQYRKAADSNPARLSARQRVDNLTSGPMIGMSGRYPTMSGAPHRPPGGEPAPGGPAHG